LAYSAFLASLVCLAFLQPQTSLPSPFQDQAAFQSSLPNPLMRADKGHGALGPQNRLFPLQPQEPQYILKKAPAPRVALRHCSLRFHRFRPALLASPNHFLRQPMLENPAIAGRILFPSRVPEFLLQEFLRRILDRYFRDPRFAIALQQWISQNVRSNNQQIDHHIDMAVNLLHKNPPSRKHPKAIDFPCAPSPA